MDPNSPLAVLHVASPCLASWDAMSGDNRVRFCGACRKHVYNLSDLPAADAQALLHATEGKVCVRFFRRADGTVLTADCPVGVRETLRKRLRRLGTVAAAVTGLWAVSTFVQATERRTGSIARLPVRLSELGEWLRAALAPTPPTVGKFAVMGEPLAIPAVSPPPTVGSPAPATIACPPPAGK